MALYVYKDVHFDEKRVLSFELSRLFGVGFARANYICSTVGLMKGCRTGNVNFYNFNIVLFLLKQYYGTDIFLKRMRENRLKTFLSFKSYKSIKHAAGLPIRGQRTRTNARTTKGLKYLNRKVSK
jgi:Ribosomal protein S13